MNTLEKAIRDELKFWHAVEGTRGPLEKARNLQELEKRFPETEEWGTPYAARSLPCHPRDSVVGITIYAQKLKHLALFELKPVGFECGHCSTGNGIILGHPVLGRGESADGKIYLEARCPDPFCGSLLYRKQL